MPRTFFLAQLSDFHLGEKPRDGFDPESAARAVIARLAELPDPIDALLVSGDVAEHAKRKEYALAAELLAPLDVPTYFMPGNHDDRAKLREAFGVPGEGDTPIDYVADLGPLRLVVVDSSVPGEDHGDFLPSQLEWLEAQLAAAPEQPTVIAMHHPPLVTAMPDWDRAIMGAGEREALGAVIERHPQVRAVVAGHMHRVAFGTLAGRPVLAAPATYLEAHPDFGAERVRFTGGLPGFVLHALTGEDFSSQVELVPLDHR